jgi:hypothetical protein
MSWQKSWDWIENIQAIKKLSCLLEVFYLFAVITLFFRETQWRSWLRHCATSWRVTGSIPGGVIGIFYSFRPYCVPGIDSASNRHEYQEYFLWGRGGRRGADKLTTACRLSWKLGARTSWNFRVLLYPFCCFDLHGYLYHEPLIEKGLQLW